MRVCVTSDMSKTINTFTICVFFISINYNDVKKLNQEERKTTTKICDSASSAKTEYDIHPSLTFTDIFMHTG